MHISNLLYLRLKINILVRSCTIFRTVSCFLTVLTRRSSNSKFEPDNTLVSYKKQTLPSRWSHGLVSYSPRRCDSRLLERRMLFRALRTLTIKTFAAQTHASYSMWNERIYWKEFEEERSIQTELWQISPIF